MAHPRSGSLDDFNRVWEIRVLQRKPLKGEAQQLLQKIADQVKPIMGKRGLQVKRLSEFCPSDKSLLGVNINKGQEIRIRLRQPSSELSFFPYEALLGTMLHELAHMERGPHDARFYTVLDELTKDCEELMLKGVNGQGLFFGSSFKLGGGVMASGSRTPAALVGAAAQKRWKQAGLVRGPQMLGGDRSLMRALSPSQAAAMAAERRMHDNLWCGQEWSGTEKEPSRGDTVGYCSQPIVKTSGEPARHCDNSTGVHGKQKSLVIDRTLSGSSSHECPLEDGRAEYVGQGHLRTQGKNPMNHHDVATQKRRRESVETRQTSSSRDVDAAQEAALMKSGPFKTWSCPNCTFLNLEILECEICATKRPHLRADTNSDGGKPFLSRATATSDFWTCGECTLDNTSKEERCIACNTWRFYRGPPVASSTLQFGT